MPAIVWSPTVYTPFSTLVAVTSPVKEPSTTKSPLIVVVAPRALTSTAPPPKVVVPVDVANNELDAVRSELTIPPLAFKTP